MRPRDEDLVFNVVWTGTVFTFLRHFVASQMAHCGARYRFVANGCPPEQIELMEAILICLLEEALRVTSRQTHRPDFDVFRFDCIRIPLDGGKQIFKFVLRLD